jgi:hypothetical protein
MTRRGRPLRFLAMVGVGWIGLRVAILWPEAGSLPAAIREAVPGLGPLLATKASSKGTGEAASGPAPETGGKRLAPLLAAHRPAPAPHGGRAANRAPLRNPAGVQFAMVNLIQYGDPEYVDGPPHAAAASAQSVPWAAPAAPHWAGAFWLVGRRGVGGAAPGAGQLGGSQAGARISYSLDPRGAVALIGRATTPLDGRGREAAIALEWRPTRLPVRIVAEQRLALDGGRSGPGLGIVGGLDARIPAGFSIEAYGQAGAVYRARTEPYADGAARITRAVGRPGEVRLSLGAGAWGGAQRGAARLDIGPAAIVDFPSVGGTHLRLAVEWRQRVAGNARPGSGIAVTLGADF